MCVAERPDPCSNKLAYRVRQFESQKHKITTAVETPSPIKHPTAKATSLRTLQDATIGLAGIESTAALLTQPHVVANR
eukprot:scaffold3974_cov140-Cylindrotheca_fusiformis.AAC.4